MKHEWRKHEKDTYIPKAKPEIVNVPPFKFFMIEGKGSFYTLLVVMKDLLI